MTRTINNFCPHQTPNEDGSQKSFGKKYIELCLLFSDYLNTFIPSEPHKYLGQTRKCLFRVYVMLVIENVYVHILISEYNNSIY